MGDNDYAHYRADAFDLSLKGGNLYPLTASGISIFQMNTGRLCNQACGHCHVEAGPDRGQLMQEEVFDLCLKTIEGIGRPQVDITGGAPHAPAPTNISLIGRPQVDITGGAPEMNPLYRSFVTSATGLGCRVKTRTNLTILIEKGYDDLPEFLASKRVEVIASLPYYLKDITDRQRGKGVFAASIEALRRLNAVGYGVQGSPLTLNLVYNPCGAFLPPGQKAIEEDFRRELTTRCGIVFNNLFTITNMPVGRFLRFLKDSGNLKRYMERLKTSYNPEAVANVMCKETLSIGWDGSLYDCDFNQMIGLKCNHGAPEHLKDFDLRRLEKRMIVTGPHCYGCAAGRGSSCKGATA